MSDLLAKQNKAICESRVPVAVREILLRPVVGSQESAAYVRTVSEKMSDGRTLYIAKISHADRPNANHRIYPKSVWESNLKRLKPLMAQGRVKGAVDHLGELEGGNLKHSPLIWRDMWMETDGSVYGKYEIVEAHSDGADLKALRDSGSKIGFSTYGFGTGHVPSDAECSAYGIHEDDADGYAVMNDDFELQKTDAVDSPSCTDAWDISSDGPPMTGAPGDPAMHMVGSPQSGDPMAPTGASVPPTAYGASVDSRLSSDMSLETSLYESTGNSVHLNHAAVGHALAAVSSGQIDHGSFSGDGTERSSANSNKFLAVDTSMSPDEKGHWKFPIFTGNKVSVKGVATAAHYSDGTYPEIHAACGRISDAIKRKEGDSGQAGDSTQSGNRLSDSTANIPPTKETYMNIAELKEKAPALHDEIFNLGKAEGAKAQKPLAEALNALLAMPQFKAIEGVNLPEREVAPKEFSEQLEAVKAESAAKDAKIQAAEAKAAELQKLVDAAAAEKAKAERAKAISAKAEELTKDSAYADVLKSDVAEASEKPEFKVEDVEPLIKKLTEKYNKLAPKADSTPGGVSLTEEEVSEQEELAEVKDAGGDYSDVKPMKVTL